MPQLSLISQISSFSTCTNYGKSFGKNLPSHVYHHISRISIEVSMEFPWDFRHHPALQFSTELVALLGQVLDGAFRSGGLALSV